MDQIGKNRTVVTACDHNFVWGAILLGLSLRYHDIDCYYHILGYDLPDSDLKILESIPDTKVFPTHKSSTRSVCTQKPMAIATADTEYIIWMDADCIVTGNVSEYLVCPDGKMQIRFRNKIENATIYRNIYRSEDKYGEIPKIVLAEWKRDVNDLSQPLIDTVSQTNCIVLTQKHKPFIDLWQEQMYKVIPSTTKGVYEKGSTAYSMTDESVINSLFAFSSKAPMTSEYLLDKDKNAYCAHFGLMPKPWRHFTTQTLKYYDHIQALIEFAKMKNVPLPALPQSFHAGNRTYETIRAYTHASFKKSRYLLSTQVRKLIRIAK